MKKISIFLLMLLFAMLLSAEDVTLPSFKYAPYTGFSGIPIGNTHYKGGTGWSWPYNDKTHANGGPGHGQDGDDTYENAEMLALISLGGISSSNFS